MALLPSVATRVTVELTRYRSAVSEFLAQTLGKSINYLLDKTDDLETQFNTFNPVNAVFVGSYTVSSQPGYPGSYGAYVVVGGNDDPNPVVRHWEARLIVINAVTGAFISSTVIESGPPSTVGTARPGPYCVELSIGGGASSTQTFRVYRLIDSVFLS